MIILDIMVCYRKKLEAFYSVSIFYNSINGLILSEP